MKKISLLSLAVAILFSCSEAPNNGNYVDATGTLLVTAKDYNTGNLITDIEAAFIGADEPGSTRKSNSNGVVSIDEIPVGLNYRVKVAAAGYAPMVCDFLIIPEALVNPNPDANIFTSYNTTITAELVKTGVNITGYIDYQNPTTNATDLSPAEGAQVQLVLTGWTNCEFEQMVFIDTVGADGIFEFTDMPEHSGFNVNFLQFTPVDDIVLSAASLSGVGSEYAGDTAKVGNSSYSRRDFAMQQLECNGTVKSKTAEVKIVFNKDIKDSDDERIFGINPINAVPPNTTISGNTLTVKPGTGGEWDAYGDTITGKVCSDEFNFTTSCVTVNCPITVED